MAGVNVDGNIHFRVQIVRYSMHGSNNNNNKRPLTPKSMPPAGDEHAKLHGSTAYKLSEW